MIQEYIEDRRTKGISEKTLILEEAYISLFLSFVEELYEREIEYFEIRPSDITYFLDRESERNSDHTIVRKISVLRNWFDFLWRLNKIPIDYMAKYTYHRRLDRSPLEIDFSYHELVEAKEKVLRSSISLNAKVVFLLIMKGLRVKDIQSLVVDQMVENEDTTTLIFNGGMEREYDVTFSDNEDIAVLSDARIQSIFRGTSYLLSTKVVGEEAYSRFTDNAMHTAMLRLQEVLGLPVTAEKVRRSYLRYLIEDQGYTVDDLVKYHGFRWETAVVIKKSIIEK